MCVLMNLCDMFIISLTCKAMYAVEKLCNTAAKLFLGCCRPPYNQTLCPLATMLCCKRGNYMNICTPAIGVVDTQQKLPNSRL